jgi:hypothetical protein
MPGPGREDQRARIADLPRGLQVRRRPGAVHLRVRGRRRADRPPGGRRHHDRRRGAGRITRQDSRVAEGERAGDQDRDAAGRPRSVAGDRGGPRGAGEGAQGRFGPRAEAWKPPLFRPERIVYDQFRRFAGWIGLMRLEIHDFEPFTVSLDGSQTPEPSNRLNRSSRRFNRRFARRFARRSVRPPFRPHRRISDPERTRPMGEHEERGSRRPGAPCSGRSADWSAARRSHGARDIRGKAE